MVGVGEKPGGKVYTYLYDFLREWNYEEPVSHHITRTTSKRERKRSAGTFLSGQLVGSSYRRTSLQVVDVFFYHLVRYPREASFGGWGGHVINYNHIA